MFYCVGSLFLFFFLKWFDLETEISATLLATRYSAAVFCKLQLAIVIINCS